MKIVDVNPFFAPYVGGIEHRMYDIAKHLASRGHDVTILTSKLSDDAVPEEKMDGFRVIRLDSKRINIYNPPYISSSGVLEALQSIDADVVNYNYRWAPSYNKALRRYDGKKVFTYHNTWGEGDGIVGKISLLNDNRFGQKTLETFDHIIAVSDFIRDDLVKRGYSPDHITVVPPCLSHDIDVGEGKGGYVLSLGRLVETKGLDYLVEAMQDVDHKLIICGKGPEEQHIRGLIDKYGLGKRIEMRGFVDEAEKIQLMKDCRFFVMPSIFESFGLAAIESMSYGRPLICTDVNGLPSTVGKGGYVVPAKDASALAHAMNDLFDDDSKCEDLAKAAVEHASRFNWDNYIPVLEDVYSKVVSGEYSSANAHKSD